MSEVKDCQSDTLLQDIIIRPIQRYDKKMSLKLTRIVQVTVTDKANFENNFPVRRSDSIGPQLRACLWLRHAENSVQTEKEVMPDYNIPGNFKITPRSETL